MNRSPEGLRRERLKSLVLRVNLEPFRHCSRPWAKPNGQVRRLPDASKFQSLWLWNAYEWKRSFHE